MCFHKNTHISLSNKYFYKSKKWKLCFGDCVVLQNNFIYQPGASSSHYLIIIFWNLRFTKFKLSLFVVFALYCGVYL